MKQASHTKNENTKPTLYLAFELSDQEWQPRTPAMAAGVTDHIWGMKELLLWRIPPWRQGVQAVA